MPAPARHTALAIVFATVCIDLLGFGLVLPLLPIYGKELLADVPSHQTGWILGLLMSCFSMMQFVCAPVWGRISDRIGRRPVLLISLAGSTFFYAVFGFASQARSLAWMFASRIGAGIAAATIPTAQAYIADVTPREGRTRGMALIGAAFGLGFTLGPLIGAAAMWISQDVGLSPWPGYAASILSASALTIAAFKLPESVGREKAIESREHLNFASLRQALATPSIGWLLLIAFLSVFSLANFEGTISLAIESTLDAEEPPAGDAAPTSSAAVPDAPSVVKEHGAGPDQASVLERLFLLFAYIGLIQSLVQGVLVRRLAKRIAEGPLATVGCLLSILGFLLFALIADRDVAAGGVALLMVAAAIEVSGIAFVFPAIQSLISRRSDPAGQGGILGAGESVSSVARITGVVFGVQLWFHAPPLPFWAAAGIMALVLGLLAVAIRRGTDWRGDEQESPADTTGNSGRPVDDRV